MEDKWIVACLDIKDNKVVKGKKFLELKEIDTPINLAKKYDAAGVDIIVFYDISASIEQKSIFNEVLKEVSDSIKARLCVGGNIRNLDDVEKALDYGANLISVNTVAIKRPEFIKEVIDKYGNEIIALSVDTKKEDEAYYIYQNGGMVKTEYELIYWLKRMENDGLKYVIVNTIDEDGLQEGYNFEVLDLINENTDLKVIASGGAGSVKDVKDVFKKENVQGALLASALHYNVIDVNELVKEIKNDWRVF